MKTRGRPKKTRVVTGDPEISKFSPRGRPGRPDEVELTLGEYEALKLTDLEGRCQKDAAILMGISQPTFSRVLKSARKAVSDGLIFGKRIKVSGGTYKFSLERSRREKDRAILLELAAKFKGR